MKILQEACPHRRGCPGSGKREFGRHSRCAPGPGESRAFRASPTPCPFLLPVATSELPLPRHSEVGESSQGGLAQARPPEMTKVRKPPRGREGQAAEAKGCTPKTGVGRLNDGPGKSRGLPGHLGSQNEDCAQEGRKRLKGEAREPGWCPSGS